MISCLVLFSVPKAEPCPYKPQSEMTVVDPGMAVPQDAEAGAPIPGLAEMALPGGPPLRARKEAIA